MTTGANQLTARATDTNAGGPPAPVGQFRSFVDAFERLGYDVGRLLSDIGVRRADLDDPDGLIPCAATGALFERALRTRPLKNVGLRLAAETPIGAHGLLDYLILTSDSVGEGWKQAARYLRLLTGAPFVVQLRDDEDPVRVVYLVDPSVPTFGVEYSVALGVLQIRGETENRVSFECVSFTHQPDDVSEFERVLGCPVRAGASWSGLAFTRDSWQMPLRRKDPILHRVLQGHAESIAPRVLADDGLAVDVCRVLASRLANGEMEIDIVARQLGMSTRTLQRRLAAAGLSYQELLEETRREAAERCMTNSSLSIGEIAYLLGYSEPAAFHRAFKRWTGVTPQAFRERQRGIDRRSAHAISAQETPGPPR
jgi:AraC-like DNA-binding protein